MEFTANQISALLEGEIEGNPDVKVNKLSKIEEGEYASISFLANPAYEKYIYDTDASIVIVNKDLELERAVKDTLTLIRVENAYECFAKVLELYDNLRSEKSGIEPQSYISDSAEYGEGLYLGAFSYISDGAKIGKNVKIHPNCFIGENAVLGDNVTLQPGVTIHHDVVVGNNCAFHSGVVIGGDGFGFAPNAENNYKKVAQLGNVVIEDDVEIGSNTCIDRATLGSTIIKKGVKLDNLIQIGHNAVVDENTVIVSQVGIAGSTKIGKNCIIAGQVGIVGHIEIADGVKIAAQSGVAASVEQEGMVVQGSPAFYIGDYKRSLIGFKQLPDILRRLEELEKNQK